VQFDDVIEGACHHLVKDPACLIKLDDRMDITGARWGAEGDEGALKLRTLRPIGGFERCWRYHLPQEHDACTKPATPTTSRKPPDVGLGEPHVV
jgi:hypothetical protein